MSTPSPRAPEHEAPKLPGIIDTLGVAYALLFRRPYLILLPIALDLYLWLGAALSARSLADAFARWMNQVPEADPQIVELTHNAIAGFDLFALVGISIPSLIADRGRDAVAHVGQSIWVTGIPWWAVLVLGAVLIVGGIAIGMVYLTMIGRLVRDHPILAAGFGREAMRNVLRMLGFIGVAIGTVLLLTMPVALFGGLLLVVGINVLSLFALLGWVAIMWAFFALFFAQDAIVLSEAGPLRAMYLSYNVVRRNIGSTAGFIIVYLLITNGTPVALQVFTTSTWGVLFALITNAFVATGVLAAAMLFYRDRVRALSTSTNLPPRGPAR